MAKPSSTPTPLRGVTPVPGLPGQRAALPEGALSKPYFGPQGDENRDPPEGAPAEPPQYHHDPLMPERKGG